MNIISEITGLLALAIVSKINILDFLTKYSISTLAFYKILKNLLNEYYVSNEIDII